MEKSGKKMPLIGGLIYTFKTSKMITVKDYTPTRREYFRVRILDKQTNNEISIIRVDKNDSLADAISNFARNMGYLRQQITYEFL